MLTVVITLTTAGADTGNFNLYSDVDGYTAAFETGVLKTSLQAGYTSYLVPNSTTIIRVMSDTACTNYVDITLVELTTTTTTTVPPTTTTTTTIPFTAEITFTTQDNIPDDYEIYMTVTSGTLLDSLGANGTVQGYTDALCSVLSDTGTFSALTLTPPLSPPSSANTPLSGNPHSSWQSRKLTSLQVQLTNINSNPYYLSVGANTYKIVGWDVCETL